MDTKKVKALLRSIELGSLSSAAEELGYTQSGLTHMMNALEDDFGLNVLIRNKTGVRLSAAGQALYDDMKKLADASDTLDKNVDTLREQNFSKIRIGSYSSVARTWLPSILENYKYSSPETDMTLSMQDIKGQYNAVKNGELDCAIVSCQPALMAGLSWTPLRDDELVAVLPGTYTVEEGPFPVEYFSGMDFLMPSGGFDMDIMPVFSGISPKNLPNFQYTNMDDASIVSMVSHGIGVSIMSRLIMKSLTENVATVSLAPAAYRKLGIIAREHRQNDRAIKTFISTAQSTLSIM